MNILFVRKRCVHFPRCYVVRDFQCVAFPLLRFSCTQFSLVVSFDPSTLGLSAIYCRIFNFYLAIDSDSTTPICCRFFVQLAVRTACWTTDPQQIGANGVWAMLLMHRRINTCRCCKACNNFVYLWTGTSSYRYTISECVQQAVCHMQVCTDLIDTWISIELADETHYCMQNVAGATRHRSLRALLLFRYRRRSVYISVSLC